MIRHALIVLPLVAACATVQVGNYNLNEEGWNIDAKEIVQRASFELRCAPEQLRLTVLATLYNAPRADSAKQVGVLGCGHQLVYVRGGSSGWVLNSSDGQAR
jgi:hypothetical protein